MQTSVNAYPVNLRVRQAVLHAYVPLLQRPLPLFARRGCSTLGLGALFLRLTFLVHGDGPHLAQYRTVTLGTENLCNFDRLVSSGSSDQIMLGGPNGSAKCLLAMPRIAFAARQTLVTNASSSAPWAPPRLSCISHFCGSLEIILHLYLQRRRPWVPTKKPDRMADTLVEFRAGKMQFVDKLLRADPRKGLIRLTQVRPHHTKELGRLGAQNWVTCARNSDSAIKKNNRLSRLL